MKTVVITGSSRGIGAATAKLFAENGFNVCVNYFHSEKAAKELTASLPSAVAVKADISKKADAVALIEAATETFGHVDVLVNNAGIALPPQLVTDVSDTDYDRVFDINMKGVHNTVSAVLPQMVNRKSGNIVNISSLWGVVGGSCETVYTASKAAVIGYTKALAKELGPSGIRVNCVAPGFIRTEMNARFSEEEIASFAEETPLCRVGDPQDVAKAVFFLATDMSDFITGQTLCVDGGRSV
ncbi:MAG: glucose 1-dehydrogenase [Clostridiales bacterium]|nr:glucose 1-dehydrogenase [Clostridiales bacterium]